MNRHHHTTNDASRPADHDRGASLVEYMLLVSLVVLVALVALTGFGGTVGDNLDDSASRVVTAVG